MKGTAVILGRSRMFLKLGERDLLIQLPMDVRWTDLFMKGETAEVTPHVDGMPTGMLRATVRVDSNNRMSIRSVEVEDLPVYTIVEPNASFVLTWLRSFPNSGSLPPNTAPREHQITYSYSAHA